MTKIYGECVSGSAHAAVTISSLAPEGCQIALEAPAESLGSDLELWIGAIGPFEITAQSEGAKRLVARFKRPLEPAIIEHFNA